MTSKILFKQIKGAGDTYYYVDGEEVCVHKNGGWMKFTIKDLFALTRAMIKRPVRKYETKGGKKD